MFGCNFSTACALRIEEDQFIAFGLNYLFFRGSRRQFVRRRCRVVALSVRFDSPNPCRAGWPVFPWAFCYCREVFDIPVTVAGHRTKHLRTVGAVSWWINIGTVQGGGGSYFPYILLNKIETMFSQLHNLQSNLTGIVSGLLLCAWAYSSCRPSCEHVFQRKLKNGSRRQKFSTALG